MPTRSRGLSAASTALVLRAEGEARVGSHAGGAAPVYRRPRLRVEARVLGVLQPGHIRVEMRLVGICGSDLHMVRTDPRSGAIAGSAPLEIGVDGRVLGHEGVGRVLAVGAGVRGLLPGDAVVFETLVVCHRCAACRRGLFNHCPNAKLLGGQADGLFRTVVDLPAELAHRVTDLVVSDEGWKTAACVEPAACALLATQAVQIRPAERVAVLGAGPIGLFVAMLCRNVLGAAVVVVEPSAVRRELVAAWADRVVAAGESLDEESLDVVVEASGALDDLDRLIPRIAPRGRVALLARGGRSLTLHHVDHLITNGISLVGSRGHLGGAVEDVLRLCRAGRLPLHLAVTAVVDGLSAVQRELESAVPLEQRHGKLLAQLAGAE